MRDEMIRSSLKRLSGSLGSPRRQMNVEPLRELYAQQRYSQLLNRIRTHLGLGDMRMRFAIVNSGGPDGAPAWVHPEGGSYPSIVSPEFRQVVVTVYVRKRFLSMLSFEGLVIALAHELAHAVLGVIGSDLCYDEEATDLAAMFLGFRDLYSQHCAQTFEAPNCFAVMQLGYLSVEEVRYATTLMQE